MEVTELISRYIADLREAITYLVAALVFITGVIGTFFFIYKKEKQKSEDRLMSMNERFIEQSAKEIETRKDMIHAIEKLNYSLDKNTKMVEALPDSIIKSFQLAFKTQ